jgi:hypothetical protein
MTDNFYYSSHQPSFFPSSYWISSVCNEKPKRDEVTEEWRRLHNEELYDLYCSQNIIRVIKSRRMRRAGHMALMGEGRGAYRVLVGRLEGKRPLGRPRRRWKDIKINILPNATRPDYFILLDLIIWIISGNIRASFNIIQLRGKKTKGGAPVKTILLSVVVKLVKVALWHVSAG